MNKNCCYEVASLTNNSDICYLYTVKDNVIIACSTSVLLITRHSICIILIETNFSFMRLTVVFAHIFTRVVFMKLQCKHLSKSIELLIKPNRGIHHGILCVIYQY